MNTTKTASQRDKIAAHLKSGKTITSMEAFSKFRITRLSAVIFDLVHRRGMKVKSIERGTGKSRYSVYYVGKKPQA